MSIPLFSSQIEKTTAEWDTENPVLGENVIGIEIMSNGFNRFKRGNGIDHWSLLPYIDKIPPVNITAAMLDVYTKTETDDLLNDKFGSTDVISVSNGGTGRSTLTSGYFLRGNGTSAVTMSSAATARDAMGLGNTTGALPIANGGTGATTANGAANNLCEYGTWTPKMQWATNTEVPKVTYQSQIGEYVRIGNIVHAWWKLRFNTSSGWTTNGDYLRIAGFPHVFANSNNQGFLSTVIIPSGASNTSYYVQTYSGYSHVGVQAQNGTALKLTNSNVGNFYFYGQLVYKING